MFHTDNMLYHAMRVSCSSRPCMILSTRSTGTDVNCAVKSYEQRHSPGWRVTTLTLSTKSLVLLTWCSDFPTKGLSILARTLATP